ncbi:galactoside 2-alpha-L-fucosyltransferase 2-like [Pecten maximus]|uniref:galactoside 2-alpha-L-fucosyltransferase 2-like n=1 Tax=Pecten maximus TaxID=6579 RepID=UPI00145801CC|nr:galactoside 2-alpha-L-fucosyltransferase 2-like [Pecten maximus]XP_033752708.1 galactoside 2-alpha-L-fucosyltransferase 2-like [Pecten maximus]
MDYKRYFGYCLMVCCVVLFVGMNFSPGFRHTSMLKYLLKQNITIIRTFSTFEVAPKVIDILPSVRSYNFNSSKAVTNGTSIITSTQKVTESRNTATNTTKTFTTKIVPTVKAEHTTPKPVADVTRTENMSRNSTSVNEGVAMPTQKPPTNIVPSRSANYSLCTRFMGGLGNHMFMFATIYGLAAKKGMSVTVGQTDYLTKIFKLDVILKEKNKDICKTYVGRGERLNCGYDERLASFPPNNNYRLGAYLQSWMYFYNASTSLRKQFSFQDRIVESKNKVIDSTLKKHNLMSRSNVTLIGVHVRRGDLVNHKFGYMVASEDYLKKAVNYFLSKGFKYPLFVICSNDLKWTKEHMPKGIRSEYMEGNSPEVDMAILGSCDHMISSVGTFSWWSAWLTGGEVTFYQWPAKEGSGLRKEFSKDYKDFFYPGWIGFP